MTLSSLEISLCFILVLSYPWSIANFAFCFSSSLRTDCHIIVSAVSEVSSEMELTPPVPFNESDGNTGKLILFL